MTGYVKNKKHYNVKPSDIYIGRGSKYGNPYRIGIDGNRDDVIRKYEDHLNQMLDDGTITVEELSDMYGFNLVCFCKPLPCHGDILIRYIKASYQVFNP